MLFTFKILFMKALSPSYQEVVQKVFFAQKMFFKSSQFGYIFSKFFLEKGKRYYLRTIHILPPPHVTSSYIF